MARSWRIVIALVMFGLVAGLVVGTAMAFLRSNPSTVDFTSGHQAGQPIDLTLQTVGTIGFGAHPTWVSYLTKAPDGNWVHTTLWNLPAHTQINVTILQYDTGGSLRNNYFGLVQGTQGATMLLNGKPVSLVDSNSGTGVGHTFSVPTLGINVPLVGVDSSAKNICSAAPCTPASIHNTIQFSFTTPGPGQYPWQCFLPCGLGFLFGTGGPMQTIGYMDGFLKVIA
jgi:heme/copper-type cytochrome/quinol oxidase subunit 2